jgi:hypothetical protein
MRLLMLGCGLLLRELSDAIVHTPHLVEAQYMPVGLHDTGSVKMRESLQQAIDSADSKRFDAIVLGYALCGTGLAGVEARSIPLVLPRAHDCIALLMGSRSDYKKYFEANSGVYFRSVGWVEHQEELKEQVAGVIPGSDANLEELIAKYGESNGRFLYEEFTRYERNYTQLTYIENGLEPDNTFVEQARSEAEEKKWAFRKVEGRLSLFRRLLAGDWQEDFLIVPPGSHIEVTYDDQIVRAVPSVSPN